jgi:hypothetical protein
MSAQRLLDIEPMILDNACFHCLEHLYFSQGRQSYSPTIENDQRIIQLAGYQQTRKNNALNQRVRRSGPCGDTENQALRSAPRD